MYEMLSGSRIFIPSNLAVNGQTGVIDENDLISINWNNNETLKNTLYTIDYVVAPSTALVFGKALDALNHKQYDI
jgi:hypothetical protein